MQEGLEEYFKKKNEEERGRNPDDIVKEQLEQEGWQRAGRENLFVTRFNSESGRFEDQKEHGEEEVKEEYLKKYGVHFDEVHIEPSHTYKYGEWRVDGGVIVFMRKSPQ